MLRRRALTLLLSPVVLLFGAASTLRGKLGKSPQGTPVLQTDGRTVALTGDESTTGVLNDKRLAGTELEVSGQLGENGTLEIGPIHTRAMWAIRSGQKRMITYWCDVCAIRTYTPGLCQCCREEMALDLIDPPK